MRFRDRREAGAVLASRLENLAARSDVIVLALPRGGVPVGFEVASALGAPLDIISVRKLGAPGREELAMGAVASSGLVYLDRETIHQLGVSPLEIEDVIRRELRELARRDQLYRSSRPFPRITGKHVILVDDGLATGASMYAAAVTVQQLKPASVTVAVPVASVDAITSLADVTDDVVAAAVPEPFLGVGLWYKNFDQTSDDEVLELMDLASRHSLTPAGA